MSTVVLPGSFDPFTLGHLDLARRAAALADRVVIAVSHNPSKKGLLGLDARKEAIAATMAQEDLADTVEVRTLPGGLLVDFCREIDQQSPGQGANLDGVGQVFLRHGGGLLVDFYRGYHHGPTLAP